MNFFKKRMQRTLFSSIEEREKTTKTQRHKDFFEFLCALCVFVVFPPLNLMLQFRLNVFNLWMR
jgi:hypothetical protein